MNIENISEEVRTRFRKGEAKLPLLPEVVLDIRKIVNDENKGAADIAKVLSESPTLSATVLRIANSAQFKRGPHEVRSLSVAIQRLGGQRTLQLVITISAKLHMNVKNKQLQGILRKNRNYALQVAVAAQHLAKLIRGVDAEEAFLAGMLHDIGVQAVVCAVSDLLIPLEYNDQLLVIQCLHREMGGRLLNHWEMPDTFETIASHHGVESDDRPKDQLIDFVDAADFLVQRSGHPVLFDQVDDIDPLHYPAVQRIGATETHLAAVEIALDESINNMEQALN